MMPLLKLIRRNGRDCIYLGDRDITNFVQSFEMSRQLESIPTVGGDIIEYMDAFAMDNVEVNIKLKIPSHEILFEHNGSDVENNKNHKINIRRKLGG